MSRLRLPDYCHYCGGAKPVVNLASIYTGYKRSFGKRLKPCCEQCLEMLSQGINPVTVSAPTFNSINSELMTKVEAFGRSTTLESFPSLVESIQVMERILLSVQIDFSEKANAAALAGSKLEFITQNLSVAKKTVEQKLKLSYKRCRQVANAEISDPEIKEAVFDRDGYACLHCGANECLSIDHIIPVVKGGSNALENLQPLCVRCNSRKGGRIYDYFPKPKHPIPDLASATFAPATPEVDDISFDP